MESPGVISCDAQVMGPLTSIIFFFSTQFKCDWFHADLTSDKPIVSNFAHATIAGTNGVSVGQSTRGNGTTAVLSWHVLKFGEISSPGMALQWNEF